MTRVELQTAETHFIAIVAIPDFQVPPEIISWEARYYIHWKESNTEMPVYCEAESISYSFTRYPGFSKE